MEIVGNTDDGMVVSNDDAFAEYVVGQVESGRMDADTGYAIVGQLLNLRALSPGTAARIAPRINPALLTRFRANAPAIQAIRATMPAVQVQPAAPQIVPSPPGPVGRSVVGVDSGATLIAAGATQDVPQNLLTYFRPERLSIGASIADLWVVNDVKLGNVSLFAGTSAVPGAVFVPGGDESPNLKRETGNAGMPLTVTVTNIDAVAHRFRAAIFGASSQPGGCR